MACWLFLVEDENPHCALGGVVHHEQPSRGVGNRPPVQHRDFSFGVPRDDDGSIVARLLLNDERWQGVRDAARRIGKDSARC
jgi:hypothetical protein